MYNGMFVINHQRIRVGKSAVQFEQLFFVIYGVLL